MAEKRERSKKRLPLDECALFCEQVSLILSAGIPLYDGVEALADSFDDTQSKEAFRKLDADVKETGSLYQATRRAGIFPDYMVGMIHIGEQTGKLDSVMRALSEYYLREDKIRRAIRSAVTYPLGLIAMMAIVIIVLVARVLPIFERVYANLGSSLSASTNAVMRCGMGTG
jgi:type IV pilus assembly protein PilC